MCEINSLKLMMKAPERRHWSRSDVFVVNFQQVNVGLIFDFEQVNAG